jgi:hypothetical protein
MTIPCAMNQSDTIAWRDLTSLAKSKAPTMLNNRAQAEQDISQELNSRGLTVSPNAMAPLSRIDFGQLMSIHDHEEQFLRRVFLDSLVRAQAARAQGSGATEVDADDVRTAMLMLGAAAIAAPEPQFSKQSMSIIQSVCPYCT